MVARSVMDHAQRAVMTACLTVCACLCARDAHDLRATYENLGDVIKMLLGHENTMVELRMEGGAIVQLRRAAFFRAGTCDGVSGVGLMLEESEKVMLRTSCFSGRLLHCSQH
jgi:hypothetical protein